jgi:glycerol dehydrogenase-like iron-containing ADH family enzyme
MLRAMVLWAREKQTPISMLKTKTKMLFSANKYLVNQCEIIGNCQSLLVQVAFGDLLGKWTQLKDAS